MEKKGKKHDKGTSHHHNILIRAASMQPGYSSVNTLKHFDTDEK
jgi:hypothetical protein